MNMIIFEKYSFMIIFFFKLRYVGKNEENHIFLYTLL